MQQSTPVDSATPPVPPADLDAVRETVRSYETKPDEYIQNTERLTDFPNLPPFMQRFMHLLPGKHILDVAFGSGRDMLYFREQGLQPEGIDMVDYFLSALQTKADMPLYRMDMRAIDLPAQSFDGVWCCSAFLHLPRADALSTLKGFARLLRPGGMLYVDVKEGEGESWVNNPDSHLANIWRFFTYYQADEMRELLEAAGFEVVEQKALPHPKFANRHSWLMFLARRT